MLEYPNAATISCGWTGSCHPSPICIVWRHLTRRVCALGHLWVVLPFQGIYALRHQRSRGQPGRVCWRGFQTTIFAALYEKRSHYVRSRCAPGHPVSGNDIRGILFAPAGGHTAKLPVPERVGAVERYPPCTHASIGATCCWRRGSCMSRGGDRVRHAASVEGHVGRRDVAGRDAAGDPTGRRGGVVRVTLPLADQIPCQLMVSLAEGRRDIVQH